MKLQCSPITHWHVSSHSPSPIFNISFWKTNADIHTLCSPVTAVLLLISYVTNQIHILSSIWAGVMISEKNPLFTLLRIFGEIAW